MDRSAFAISCGIPTARNAGIDLEDIFRFLSLTPEKLNGVLRSFAVWNSRHSPQIMPMALTDSRGTGVEEYEFFGRFLLARRYVPLSQRESHAWIAKHGMAKSLASSLRFCLSASTLRYGTPRLLNSGTEGGFTFVEYF